MLSLVQIWTTKIPPTTLLWMVFLSKVWWGSYWTFTSLSWRAVPHIPVWSCVPCICPNVKMVSPGQFFPAEVCVKSLWRIAKVISAWLLLGECSQHCVICCQNTTVHSHKGVFCLKTLRDPQKVSMAVPFPCPFFSVFCPLSIFLSLSFPFLSIHFFSFFSLPFLSHSNPFSFISFHFIFPLSLSLSLSFPFHSLYFLFFPLSFPFPLSCLSFLFLSVPVFALLFPSPFSNFSNPFTFLSGSSRNVCHKFESSSCEDDLHYNTTFLSSEDQIASNLTVLQPIIDSKCSADVEKYMCFTRIPPCAPKDTSVVHLPCKSLCDKIGKECGNEFSKRDIPLPHCNFTFPDAVSPTGLCELRRWPAPWPWPKPPPSKNTIYYYNLCYNLCIIIYVYLLL